MENDASRISRFATCGGCAAKVGPGELRALLGEVAVEKPAALLVGTETSDDAGVFQISSTDAVVCTADFITPLIDDPYLYGQIAAANALSDVYAMGGRPITALALCMFPHELSADAARAIVAGGRDKVADAGAVVVGGHTVRSAELFYGLAVTGLVSPSRVVRNVGARPGDRLILTKPLGSGLIVNGLRKGLIDFARARPVIARLAELNRAAAEVMVEVGVHAATDVTGFGLVGHALHMARGSGVSMTFWESALPVFPHVADMLAFGVSSQSHAANRAFSAPHLRILPMAKLESLIHDPQTSGGLLMSVAAERADQMLSVLHARGVVDAVVIGEVTVGEPTTITLSP